MKKFSIWLCAFTMENKEKTLRFNECFTTFEWESKFSIQTLCDMKKNTILFNYWKQYRRDNPPFR